MKLEETNWAFRRKTGTRMNLRVFFCGTLAGLVMTFARAQEPANLPGTQVLILSGDLSTQMHEAALRDMDRTVADSLRTRAQLWHRDVSSPEAYERSIEANREGFKK